MKTASETIRVKTSARNQMIDITDKVAAIVKHSGIDTGTAMIFCPHTTAAITINENADPDVQHDILMTLDEILPQFRKGYRHAEGNSDAHVKSSLVGASETVFVENGRFKLGTWQGIYFCEFDGPRNRRVDVHVTG